MVALLLGHSNAACSSIQRNDKAIHNAAFEADGIAHLEEHFFEHDVGNAAYIAPVNHHPDETVNLLSSREHVPLQRGTMPVEVSIARCRIDGTSDLWEGNL